MPDVGGREWGVRVGEVRVGLCEVEVAAAVPDPYGGARAAESGDRDLRKPPDTKRGKQKHTKQVFI